MIVGVGIDIAEVERYRFGERERAWFARKVYTEEEMAYAMRKRNWPERLAGFFAAKEAARKARPVLLEPVMRVEVVVPDEYMGPVNGDLISRRGRLEGTEILGSTQIIKAMVPLSEMFGYATAIRSLSKGRASYSMEPLTFEQVPNSVLTTILDAASKKPAART